MTDITILIDFADTRFTDNILLSISLDVESVCVKTVCYHHSVLRLILFIIICLFLSAFTFLYRRGPLYPWKKNKSRTIY